VPSRHFAVGPIAGEAWTVLEPMAPARTIVAAAARAMRLTRAAIPRRRVVAPPIETPASAAVESGSRPSVRRPELVTDGAGVTVCVLEAEWLARF
jgi:hypothetical protein